VAGHFPSARGHVRRGDVPGRLRNQR
jgi:hypothetical protein